MKKIVLLVLIATFLVSCGGSKVVRISKRVIKGDWVLNSITYNKPGKYNVTLLDDVSKVCFENSTWSFVPNNNTGTYTITDANCNAGERYFIFTIKEIDEATGLYDFLLKPVDAKGKSETNKGFRLKLSALSDQAMEWTQTVSLEGAPFVISMNFAKKQE